jgi:squid-like protein
MTESEQQYAENGTNGDSESMDQGSADTNPGREDDRKLFIGGLSWETSEKDLNDFFSKFGELENVNLKTDPNTGRSRGFAFVVFKSADSVESVLAAGDLTIQNKKVEAKRAKARQGKVFVGGLPHDISDDDIKAHFSKFGAVVEMEMPFDKIQNRRKGFCFITFESEAAMKDLLRNPKQMLGGKEVDVKKATPRGNEVGGPGGFMRGGGRGGFRGAPGAGMMRGGPMRGGPRGGAQRGGGGWGGPGGNWGGGNQQWGQGYGGGYGYDGGYGGGGYGNGGGYGYDGGYGGGGYGGGGYGGGAYGGGGYGQAAGGVRGGARGARGGGQRYQPY